MKEYSLLKKLIDAKGVSGAEGNVRAIIKKEIEKHVDEVIIDNVGNLIAKKKGRKPKVMLASHMDEIGLMVDTIAKDGRIFFSTIGGIEPISLIGQKVAIKTKKGLVNGVITTPEINDADEVNTLPKIEDMYVDTGLNKDQLNKIGIDVGNYIFFNPEGMCCLGSTDYILGKALDDRIGCFILIELAKRLKKNKNEIYFVFTVQEEIGLYGAKTSAYQVNPDWAIAVDVTNSDDASIIPVKEIGKGPCITIKDSDMISNRCINEWLEKIAKKNKINLQKDVTDKGTTDALMISISRGGTPTSVIGVAVRNLHSSISIASLRDIKDAIKLLEQLLKNPPKTCFV